MVVERRDRASERAADEALLVLTSAWRCRSMSLKAVLLSSDGGLSEDSADAGVVELEGTGAEVAG